MAAKPVDPNPSFLADLADHAHKLIDQFISLPASERERAIELLYEVQFVISEFRRLRPPPTFATARKLRLVSARPVCEVCGKPVDPDAVDTLEAMRSVYHVGCVYGRKEK